MNKIKVSLLLIFSIKRYNANTLYYFINHLFSPNLDYDKHYLQPYVLTLFTLQSQSLFFPVQKKSNKEIGTYNLRF